MHKFDEMYVQLPYGGADTVRAHYQAYAAWLARQPAGTIAARRDEAEMIFRRVGITFAVCAPVVAILCQSARDVEKAFGLPADSRG